ncbi:MAG: AsmA family protein, partial [Alphaproteobacteria bacterium]
QLPGGSDVALFGVIERVEGATRFDGQVELASDNLRTLLAWAGVEADTVPAERLRRFAYASQVAATADAVTLEAIDLRLDTTRVTGRLAVGLGVPLGLDADLALDKLNVDAYLPAGSDAGGTPVLPADVDATLALAAEQLTVRGETVNGVALAARLSGGALTVTRLAAEDVAGAKVGFDGTLDPFTPRYDATFEIAAADASGIARLAGVDPAWRLDRLGRVALAGTAKGDGGATELHATAKTEPFDARIDGTLALSGATPSGDITYSGDVRDAARAFEAFALAAPEAIIRLGALGLDGTYKGDGKAGQGRLKAAGGFGVLDASGTIDLAAQPAAFDVKAKGSGDSRASALAALGLALDGPDGGYAIDATAKGSLAAVVVAATLTSAGATASATGELKGLDGAPSYDLALAVDHPDLDGFLRDLAGAGGTGAAGPLGLALRIVGDGAQARAEAIEATLGPANLKGTMTARLDGAVPFVDATFETGDLVLDPFLGAPDGTGDSGPRWSAEPLALDGLRSLDGHATLSAASIAARDLRLENAVIEATLEVGVLTVTRLAGRTFGGTLEASGRLAAGELHGLDATIRLAGVDARRALSEIAGYDDLSGRLDLDARLDSLGQSEADLVGNLAGDARVALADGVIDGYDLTAINQRLSNLDNVVGFAALIGTSLQGGSTPIRAADGTFTIERGVARSTDLRALMDGAEAQGEATIDLPRWTVAATGQALLLGHRESPPLGVRIKGPLDDPRTSFDTKALEAFVAKRVVGTAIKTFGDDKTKTIFDILTGEPSASEPAPEPLPLPELLPPEDSSELPLPEFPEPSAELPAEGEDELPEPAQQGQTTEQQLLQDLLQGVLGGQN